MFDKSSNYPIFFTLPLLVYFAYTFYMILQNPGYFTGILAISSAVHEGGHAAFLLIGNQFLSTAAGTIFQLGLPIMLMVGLLRQDDYFGFALGFGVLGINLFHVSGYIGDAMHMEKPVLMFFGEGTYMHDWYYMLSEMGILGYYDNIAFMVYLLAILSFLVCFGYSGLLIFNRFRDGDL